MAPERVAPNLLAGDQSPEKSFNKSRKRVRGGIGGLIFLANFAGVVVLIMGTFLFNELRTGLTQSRVDTLRAQGQTIASVLSEAAVPEDAAPYLDEGRTRAILRRLFREPGGRLRVFGEDLHLIADSAVLYAEVTVQPLPELGPSVANVSNGARKMANEARLRVQGAIDDPTAALQAEITSAAQGEIISRERMDEDGRRVVSVSVPISRVRRVVGVLTLESSDINNVIARERRGLLPFILAAIVVSAVSAAMLAWAVARPLRQLADAAEAVESGQLKHFGVEELMARQDELGELASALSSMTGALIERVEANEQFAADVAHEIKNPLAAIRNAAELIPRAEGATRARLEKIILDDARRVDRLITDISNASRLDAELARSELELFPLREMLQQLCETYNSIAHSRDVHFELEMPLPLDRLLIRGQEEVIARVLTNLLDNALSFSPKDTAVTIGAVRHAHGIEISIEDCGPGIPPEALEKIFSRFYTHRPEGQAVFGTHSGLGLSIARQIITAHGGTLNAANVRLPDGAIKGARFTLILPQAE